MNRVLSQLPDLANTVPGHHISDWAYKVLKHSKSDWVNKVLNRLPDQVNIVPDHLILD